MIIANLNYSKSELVSRMNNFDELCKYVRSTIPEKYRHVDAIYHNTRYYLNTCVLEDDTLNLSVKKQLSDILTKNIRVVGVLGEWVPCSELDRRTNLNRVFKYYKGDLK